MRRILLLLVLLSSFLHPALAQQAPAEQAPAAEAPPQQEKKPKKLPRSQRKYRRVMPVEWTRYQAGDPVNLGSYPNGTPLIARNQQKYFSTNFKIKKKDLLKHYWVLLQCGTIGTASQVQVIVNRQYIGEISGSGRKVNLLCPASLLNQGWNLITMREIDPFNNAYVTDSNQVVFGSHTSFEPNDTVKLTAFRPLGKRIRHVEATDSGALIKYRGGREVTMLFPRNSSAVRIVVDEGAAGSLFEKYVLGDTTKVEVPLVARRIGKWFIQTNDRIVEVDPRTPSFYFYHKDTLVRDQVHLLQANETVLFTWPLLRGEHLYGLGENTSAGNGSLHKEYTVDQLWLKHDFVKCDKPIPFMLSNQGLGFSLNSSYASSYDLGRELPGRNAFFLDDHRFDAYVYLTTDPRRQIMEYTRFTGRPEMPPKWAFGLWSSYVEGQGVQPNVALYESLIESYNKRNYPVSVIALDPYWQADKFTSWEWRRPTFSSYPSLLGKMRGNSLRLSLWSSPFLNENSEYLQEAQQRRLLMRRGGSPASTTWWMGNKAFLLDFSNPATGPWWLEKMRPRLLDGAMAIKLDGGDGNESPPWMEGHGGSMREMHNLYPVIYAKAVYEGLRSLPDSMRRLIFIRTGYSGIQRYPVAWGGDQHATFEGGKVLIKAGQQSGLAGIAFWAPDMGGFDKIPSEQYFIRSMQWGFFAPISRMHGPTIAPWEKSERAAALTKPYAILRHRLIPTLYSYAWHSVKTGLPMMQPCFLAFPKDSTCHHMTYQYMLGPDLLIAPIIDSAAHPDSLAHRDVLLPKAAHWWDYWSRRQFNNGGRFKLSYALGRLPIFVRGGAIFVMSDTTTRAINHPTRMFIHIWPGGKGQMTYYEDDGETNGYRQGKYFTCEIKYEENKGRHRLTIGKAKGWLPKDAVMRDVTVRLETITGIKKTVMHHLPGNLPKTRVVDQGFEAHLPLLDLRDENVVEFQDAAR